MVGGAASSLFMLNYARSSASCAVSVFPVLAALQITIVVPVALVALYIHGCTHPALLRRYPMSLEAHFHVLSGGYRPPDQLMFTQQPTEVARPGKLQDPCLPL